MKPRIRIVDTQFSHTPQGSFGTGNLNTSPEFFDWYRDSKPVGDVVVLTESCCHLVDRQPEKIKILLIIEPPMINSNSYEWISKPENFSKFTWVLTYNEKLISRDPRFMWYPFGGCWINKSDWDCHVKHRNMSIVASSKKQTEGHRLRHSVIERFPKYLDLYGNGYAYVENKITALKDYRYSIVIENDPCPGFFSEKLIDCFVTGTVPVFWGDENIVSKHFDPAGIVFFESTNDLEKKIHKLDIGAYEFNIGSIYKNFHTAQQFTLPENWLWKNLFNKIVENNG